MCEHRTASKREMNPCRKPRVSSVHEGEWEKIKWKRQVRARPCNAEEHQEEEFRLCFLDSENPPGDF